MTNTPSKQISNTRCPDRVTEVRMGNTVLTVSGYFKRDIINTATDKMAKVLLSRKKLGKRKKLW